MNRLQLATGRVTSFAAALVALVALISFLGGCDDQPSTFVVDDFESGALADWQSVGSGSAGKFVYSEGKKGPIALEAIPTWNLPDPPQGKFAAVTDLNGPGTRILYRDVRLDGRFTLHMTVFSAGIAPISTPETLAHDVPGTNEQFRIDLVRPSAPIDSVAKADVLLNVFHTPQDHVGVGRPTGVRVDVSRWAGQTVRLRLAATENRAPLRAGVDNIRFEWIGKDAGDRVELLVTPEPSSAVDLVLHRMSEADALAALSARAQELAGKDHFSGAVLVARHGKVLLENAWGRANCPH